MPASSLSCPDARIEDLELWYPVIRLREAGARVRLLGTGERTYRGKHGLSADADAPVSSVQPGDLDALVVPGGYAPDRMRRDESLLTLVCGVAELDRLVAFIYHAGWVPISAGIVAGRRVTSAPSIRDDLTNAGADAPDVMRGCAGVPAPGMATRCRWPERGARC